MKHPVESHTWGEWCSPGEFQPFADSSPRAFVAGSKYQSDLFLNN